MTPLMQTIFDELRACELDRYIDAFEHDTRDMELEELYTALSTLMPEHCRELFDRYMLVVRTLARMELEAMFQAAYAAARELR